MKIWIDADAAPRDAKELVFRASQRRQLAVTLVANQPLALPPGHGQVSFVLVPGAPDAADRYMIDEAQPGDLAITADIPLASALVAKGVIVLDPRGKEHTASNIGERLAVRDLMDNLRQTGEISGGGPAPYSAKDRQTFANKLDQVLTRALKTKR